MTDGPFIGCGAGRFYYFQGLHEGPEDCIDLDILGRSLSRTVRYRGLTTNFYSVALHSYLGAQFVELASAEVLKGITGAELEWNANDRLRIMLLFLLHDAPEAYVGDIPSPLKNSLIVKDPGPAGMVTLESVQDLENSINARIHSELGIPPASELERGIIKALDNALFQWEYALFFGCGALESIMGTSSGRGETDTALSVRLMDTALGMFHRSLQWDMETVQIKWEQWVRVLNDYSPVRCQ